MAKCWSVWGHSGLISRDADTLMAMHGTHSTVGTAVIERALAAYAACSSYVDEGEYVLESSGPAGLGAFRDIRPFRTRFLRPGRIMYAFDAHVTPGQSGAPQPAFAIWNGGQPNVTPIRWWWNLAGQVSESADATTPIAAATGISGGSALLLLPTLLGMSNFPGVIESLVNVRSAGQEELQIMGERVPCDVVLAQHKGAPGQEIQFGFDLRSGLLVRVEKTSGNDREITSIMPLLNTPVGDDQLVFVPPAGVRGSWWVRMLRRIFMS